MDSGLHAKRDEQMLVGELKNGNILAFNTLFRQYSGRLYRFAIGFLKSEQDAEELVQEVFGKIWEKRTSLNKELSFKSYLFTIASNIIKKKFRKQAHMEEYLKADLAGDLDVETLQQVNYDSLLGYVKELVARLPEKRKTIFEKSRFEGMTSKEIAAELGLSPKTVDNHLSEALKFLRANLGQENLMLVLFLSLFIF